MINNKSQMKMKPKGNVFGLDAGDTVTFTNSVNSKCSITISRVSDKSYWNAFNNSRGSWGSMLELSKYPDFKITRKKRK
jgi:hypothetical protein